MRLGIMQPYFLPYIGYISLIKHTDSFILLDEVQFIRHGWIERNRILKQTGGWQYISVPLNSHSQKTSIKEITINNSVAWKKRIIDQIGHYNKAPFYYQVKELLEDVLREEVDDIVTLNHITLTKICKYLEINTPIYIFSAMGMKLDKLNEPDDWALAICKNIGNVTEYWNPPGGKSFFQVSKYIDAGIEVKFQQMTLLPYRQKSDDFISGLSIIDVMMFNDIETIHKMLDRYEFI